MLILKNDNKEHYSVLTGDWFEDGWITPYVRFSIPGFLIESEISFSFYKPGNIEEPREILFRIDAQAVHKKVIEQPQEICTTSFSVPLKDSDANKDISISVSVDKYFTPSNQDDQRKLGLVLSEISISSQQYLQVNIP